LNQLHNVWREVPIAWLAGVRRSGKTTLAQSLEADQTLLIDCDFPEAEDAAKNPSLFFRNCTKPIVILDEVHHLKDPSLLRQSGGLLDVTKAASALGISRPTGHWLPVIDWLIRLRSVAHVNWLILFSDRLPKFAHSALRLTCNHAGYAPLWREQLGEAWREAGTAFTWPVLSGDDARWAVRAAMILGITLRQP
jgi:hypothetical protein